MYWRPYLLLNGYFPPEFFHTHYLILLEMCLSAAIVKSIVEVSFLETFHSHHIKYQSLSDLLPFYIFN